MNVCSPGYFRVRNVPLLRGRLFDERDSPQSPPVLLISDSMAGRYFHGQDPIGRRLKFDPYWRSIVGVVADVRHRSLTGEIGPQVYLPYAQFAVPRMELVARTQGHPAVVASAMRAELASMNRNLPLGNVRTMEQLVADSIAPRKFSMLLAGVFAALALVLAAIGIYGTATYAVAQRTAEIGIRIAVGARPADIAKLILRDGGAVVLRGLLIGLLASLIVVRTFSALLYNVTPQDPLTLIAVMVILATVAGTAMILPARRAVRVDPLVAIRCE